MKSGGKQTTPLRNPIWKSTEEYLPFAESALLGFTCKNNTNLYNKQINTYFFVLFDVVKNLPACLVSF